MAYVTITTTRTFLVQGATCIECGSTWEGFPSDFLRFVRGLDAALLPNGVLMMGTGAWVTCGEVPAEGMISGYCAPCAKVAADADHEEYTNGNWERRNLEDERWVWAS